MRVPESDQIAKTMAASATTQLQSGKSIITCMQKAASTVRAFISSFDVVWNEDIYSKPGCRKMGNGREFFVVRVTADQADFKGYLIKRSQEGVCTVLDLFEGFQGTMGLPGNRYPDLRKAHLVEDLNSYFTKRDS